MRAGKCARMREGGSAIWILCLGWAWAIPKDAKKPEDSRKKKESSND